MTSCTFASFAEEVGRDWQTTVHTNLEWPQKYWTKVNYKNISIKQHIKKSKNDYLIIII